MGMVEVEDEEDSWIRSRTPERSGVMRRIKEVEVEEEDRIYLGN